MKPGRTLDALVAEKVMGFYVHRGEDGPDGYVSYNTEYKSRFLLDQYSTEITAAWEVLEVLRSQGWSFSVSSPYKLAGGDQHAWRCTLDHKADTDYEVEADSAPHAICLAALKACGAIEEIKE